jgi:hypothetical protein
MGDSGICLSYRLIAVVDGVLTCLVRKYPFSDPAACSANAISTTPLHLSQSHKVTNKRNLVASTFFY